MNSEELVLRRDREPVQAKDNEALQYTRRDGAYVTDLRAFVFA